MMIWKKSHFLTKIFTPALRLWLNSQLDTVQGLELQLISSDQQLFQGIIPKVFLQSDFAIYQGLHFDQINLTAEEIQVNMAQVLRGEPLHLLKPVSISVKMRITERHLNDSLPSFLLQSGLRDVLLLLFKTDYLPCFHWDSITLEENGFILKGKRLSSFSDSVLIQGDVRLNGSQQLLISPMKVEGLDLNQEFAPIELDLGSSIQLDNLTITQDAIFLQGNLIVFT